MKKLMVLLMGILFVAGGMVHADDLSFDDYKGLITKNVVLENFTLNKPRSFGTKHTYRVEFKGDEEKMEMISFTLHLSVQKFTAMDKTGDPEAYTYKDRSALYKDGKKAGMATYIIQLKNQKGKFIISHRVFGGTFTDRAGFEKLIDKIGLENLEK